MPAGFYLKGSLSAAALPFEKFFSEQLEHFLLEELFKSCFFSKVSKNSLSISYYF
jgi:hypothetical protein